MERQKKCVDVPAIKGEEITQISREIDNNIMGVQ